MLFPLQGLAWVRFEKRNDTERANDLLELVAKIPKPGDPKAAAGPSREQLFSWIGQLREFAAAAEEPSHRPADDLLARIDAAVESQGSDAVHSYEEGRDRARSVAAKFDRDIAAARDASDDFHAKTLNVQCRRLVHYAEFPLEKYVEEIRAGLYRDSSP